MGRQGFLMVETQVQLGEIVSLSEPTAGVFEQSMETL